jgi:phosphate acetyltransferase
VLLEQNLNNEIGNYSVGAMQLRTTLHLKEKALVITPGDRADFALQANESANYPAISGIVLTGNIVPDTVSQC